MVVTKISLVIGLWANATGAYGPVVAKVRSQVPLVLNSSIELLLMLDTKTFSVA